MDERRRRALEFQDRIREVAYLMWEAGGGLHGRSLEYWLAAEAEVLAVLEERRTRLERSPAEKPTAAPDPGEPEG